MATNKKNPTLITTVGTMAATAAVAEYQDHYQKTLYDSDYFWDQTARQELRWYSLFHRVQDCDLHAGRIAWFLGGKLNVTDNCIDRHLPERANQVAILWEGDTPDQIRKITYLELHQEVSRLANVLKSYEIKKGDRVAIYMPMVPEAAFAMLACARIGAVHSVVFAGFSAESLRDRICDAKCTAVITADEAIRGGKTIPLKRITDEAIMACPLVKTIFIVKRTGNKIPFYPERNVWLDEEMKKQMPYCPAEVMDSEDPLFLLYTSGSTGKPKGVTHTTAGYLLYTKLTHRLVFDHQEGDIFGCMADIGWITGHSYIIYGPLANGATTFMFEGIPIHPHPGRYWEMVERHKMTQIYTSPTAIRTIARESIDYVKKYDRSTLRVLGTVGEPINEEAWKWYYEVVGEKRCDIVDTWWQTETGGIMITPLPKIHSKMLKPGWASYPFFGIRPVVLNEKGEELNSKSGSEKVEGLLAIKNCWPGMARTIYGDHQRFYNSYLAAYPGYYLTGDGCRLDEEGRYRITGRVDDVINVSGHRLGTAEVENALSTHPACAESAVVGYPHEIKGQATLAYVVLKEGYESNGDLLGELRNEARHHIGAFATIDKILIAKALPKTRSGKIMRRVLRKIASAEYHDLGDLSTLADPSVVEQLIHQHKIL
ncbi:MAG: acetate--CoA ligase [Oligoflexia bacterium]|nr:acetate--CoA ligase [Oligoflexia bacterium]MBF0367097.1 acetate--CoA ligase [Oligoflexia bacterium]